MNVNTQHISNDTPHMMIYVEHTSYRAMRLIRHATVGRERAHAFKERHAVLGVARGLVIQQD